MKTTTSAILFAGVASATISGGWTGAKSFKTPANNNNQCNDQEKSGYSWGNLQTGSFSSYNGYSFSGFECNNSFGKRDPLTKRTFGGKVIKGQVDASSGPKFSCSADKDFSIKEYQVSVSKDTDVEFHYKMSDGSDCKHTSSCKSGGTVVQNSQCGGAKEVTFKLPQGSKSGCDIGIHSIGFDCSPPVSSTPPKPSSTPVSSAPPSSRPNSSPAVPTSSSVAVISSSSKPDTPKSSSSTTPVVPEVPSSAPVRSSSTPVVPEVPSSAPIRSSSTPVVPDVPSSVPVQSSSTPAFPASSSPASSRNVGPSSSFGIPSSSYAVPSSSFQVPSSSKGVQVPSSSVPAPSSSTPNSPVTASSSSIPVVPIPSSSAPVVPIPSSSVLIPSSSKPSPPAPSAPCPDVLPQCLNTWIGMTDCKDNSDYDCYCKKAEYTKQVIQCVSSYGLDTNEIQKALSYFVGICAAYVPENPGLITDCPSSIPLTGAPTPLAASSTPVAPIVSSSGPAVPPVVLTTVIVSTSVSTCEVGQTITQAGTTSVLTAPSVSTIYVTSTSTLPAVPPASSTPVAPIISSSGPVVPSVSGPAGPSVVLTTVVVSTSVSTCSVGQTITQAGTTSVLTAPSMSTIYVTSTSTLPCTKCDAPPPASTPASPVTNAPVVPYTTITVAQTYTVPCTYSTGVSIGYEIPSSSTVTTLSTSVVVPQVQFTTAAPVAGSTAYVGLAQGPPTALPALGTTPASPVTTGILTAPGGFGTTYVPTRASSSIVMQTVNAAPRLGSGSVVGLFAGGALAMFAL
ncbi:hypothetical protein EJ08DRAFT_664076 [Tothia fuscella]|uniref:CFEM domain-containing protein n=1 Tax=Tothia fuscella TaxID=1048955 RepID=A0A9P4NJS0_9PEZI|nr:hypothetical protein EJ08DRAFT_664076 [Tothia fuscella]